MSELKQTGVHTPQQMASLLTQLTIHHLASAVSHSTETKNYVEKLWYIEALKTAISDTAQLFVVGGPGVYDCLVPLWTMGCDIWQEVLTSQVLNKLDLNTEQLSLVLVNIHNAEVEQGMVSSIFSGLGALEFLAASTIKTVYTLTLANGFSTVITIDVYNCPSLYTPSTVADCLFFGFMGWNIHPSCSCMYSPRISQHLLTDIPSTQCSTNIQRSCLNVLKRVREKELIVLEDADHDVVLSFLENGWREPRDSLIRFCSNPPEDTTCEVCSREVTGWCGNSKLHTELYYHLLCYPVE